MEATPPTLKNGVSCTRNHCFQKWPGPSKVEKLIQKAALLELILVPKVAKLLKLMCQHMVIHMVIHVVIHMCSHMCPQNASKSCAETPLLAFDC